MSAVDAVVNVGADLLADAIDAQAVPVTRVDWRPPMEGTEADLAKVAADPRRPEANARALAAMLEVTATLVDVVPASDALGLQPGEFLHAGPPIEWARAPGPLRGALMGGAALEGLVDDPEDAVALFEAGTSVSLEPCHHRSTVGPMAGVVTPSMWLWVLEDAASGRRTYCSLNEGLGKVLRYGAYGPEVLTRLRWMGDVLGPLLQRTVQSAGPVDVTGIRTQTPRDGRRGPQPQPGGTPTSPRDRPPAGHHRDGRSAVAEVAAASSAATTTSSSTWPCPPASSRSTRPAASTARRWSWRWPATGRTSASRSPVPATSGSPARRARRRSVPRRRRPGRRQPGHRRLGDHRDGRHRRLRDGDRAGDRPVRRRSVPDVLRHHPPDATRSPSARTRAGRRPVLEFQGTPTGIDVTKVRRTGILPQINTGMAGKVAGVGQVGAGLVTPPAEIFPKALARLAELART